ncbi:MAG: hypothetical protein WBP03_01275 [Candidatus Saccharimonadales bacterium]
MPRRVCLIYGITEGPWHGRAMRAAFARRGWELVANPSEADIVVAHSGGVFFIPLPRADQQLLLIDPTCTADRAGARHALRFIGWEMRHTLLSREAGNFLRRMCHNLFYILVSFRRNREIVRHFYRPNITAVLRHPRLIITQSDNRAWFDEQTLQRLADSQKLHVHYIRSHHDDCWNHPDRYLDLLSLLNDSST